MSDSDPPRLAGIQEVVTALIERGIAASLGDLDRTMARWKSGDLTALETHDAVIAYANIVEALVKRIMTVASLAEGSPEGHPNGLIRDAFDAGLISADQVKEITGQPPGDLAPANSLVEPTEVAPDKKTVIDELLDRGPVLIHFDARRDDVQVPARFKIESKLVLRFGYSLSPPIVDLLVDERGISGTLTFGGVPCACFLPWRAVYAAVIDGDQRGMVWPDDIPEELLLSGSDGIDPEGVARSGPLASVPTSRADGTGPVPTSRSKRPSHLKLVE